MKIETINEFVARLTDNGALALLIATEKTEVKIMTMPNKGKALMFFASHIKPVKKYHDESDCPGNVMVFWHDKKYKTGNRYHKGVELYRNEKFFRTVAISQIRAA